MKENIQFIQRSWTLIFLHKYNIHQALLFSMITFSQIPWNLWCVPIISKYCKTYCTFLRFPIIRYSKIKIIPESDFWVLHIIQFIQLVHLLNFDEGQWGLPKKNLTLKMLQIKADETRKTQILLASMTKNDSWKNINKHASK